MTDFNKQGNELRAKSKDIVLEFMKSKLEHVIHTEGITQTVIFRECGFDWGDYLYSKSTQQQYWVVALLRELEAEGKIVRDKSTKKWRLL